MRNLGIQEVLDAVCAYLKVTPWLTKTGIELVPKKNDEPLVGGVIKESDIPIISDILRAGFKSMAETAKKLEPSSCLSCRFCQRGAGGKRFTCYKTFVEQCFDGPVTFDSEAVAKYDFFCTFHEYKPEEDYHWRTYGDDGSPKEEKRAPYTVETDPVAPKSGAGGTGNIPRW
jgi:hypothetical protein